MHSPPPLDRHKPGGAVAARSGQDDADRPRLPVLGERREELVDRVALGARLLRLDETEHAIIDQQGLGGNDHVDAVRLDPHPILDVHHGHGGVPAKQFGEQTGARRLEMLDDDETHAAVGGHGVQERDDGFQPTRRHADSDDRKVAILSAGPGGTCFRRPAGSAHDYTRDGSGEVRHASRFASNRVARAMTAANEALVYAEHLNDSRDATQCSRI